MGTWKLLGMGGGTGETKKSCGFWCMILVLIVVSGVCVLYSIHKAFSDSDSSDRDTEQIPPIVIPPTSEGGTVAVDLNRPEIPDPTIPFTEPKVHINHSSIDSDSDDSDNSPKISLKPGQVRMLASAAKLAKKMEKQQKQEKKSQGPDE